MKHPLPRFIGDGNRDFLLGWPLYFSTTTNKGKCEVLYVLKNTFASSVSVLPETHTHIHFFVKQIEHVSNLHSPS